MRARSRSRVGAIAAAALVVGMVAGTPIAAQAAVSPTAPVVINEVYGGGGNSGAPFNQDFVELYNATNAAVDLSAWSVQYASATGTSWATTTLKGSIQAHGTYVVGEALNAANGVAFGNDATGTIAMAAGAGKVALVNSTSALSGCGTTTCSTQASVVDFVGFGTTATEGGNGAGDHTGATSNTTSASRDASHTNTGVNAADFTVGAPTPAPCGATCGATGPVDVGEKSIAELQGTGSTSPFAGNVATTKGVVTAAYPSGGFFGYYIQTPGTGGALDLGTHTASDGIFVFQPSGALPAFATVGEYVQVKGTVSEFNGLTELSVPAVQATDLATPPAPVTASTTDGWPRTDAARESLEGMLYRPNGDFTVTDTFNTNSFGEVELGVGDSPLIQWTEVAKPGTPEAAAVKADDDARMVTLDDGSSTNFTATDSSGLPTTGNQTPPYLSLSNPLRVGERATFTAPVVVDFRNSLWKFQPTARVVGPDNVGAPITWTSDRPAAPDATAIGNADLRVGSFNVLNFFTTLGVDTPGCTAFLDRDGNGDTVQSGCLPRGAWDAEDLTRQQTKIVKAINTLGDDVLGLSEVENSAVVDGNPDEALNHLVDALNTAAGSDVWAANPSSAELPATSEMDVITSAIIYKKAKVTRVGAARALGTESGTGGAFVDAREPIAQVFQPTGGGEPFLFVINHFKSKGSAGPFPGDADSGDGQGASVESRVRQAKALRDWVGGLTSESGVSSVFLAGDFNSYTQEDPLQVLYSAGYTDVESHFDHHDYSYSFDGYSGSLDHVLVNDAALTRVTGTDTWNINAEESVALEYSRFNTHATDFYDDKPYRASDHDPVVVGITAGRVASHTTLSATGTSQPFGTSSPQTLTAAVTLDRGAAAIGTVDFAAGSRDLGSSTVSNGAATLAFPADVPAGTYQVVATFTPTGSDASGSESDPLTFTVTKAKSTTGLSVQVGKVKSKGGAPPYVLDMTAPVSLETGQPAQGVVTFFVDGQRVAQATVFDGTARAAASADKGTVTVTATFVPSDPADIAGSDSAPQTVRVK
ncbi:MAG TPA: ExeM/NucH family extracellular endonuclease [Actinomycetes bacterium]